MSTVSGCCSIAPASAFAATRTSTVPPLTRNISTEPPNRTEANTVTNTTRATGCAMSVLAMVLKMSRRLPCSSSARSPPSTTATSTAAPTMGTARRIWNAVSATNWMATVCQLAAASKAPRLSRCFRSNSFHYISCILCSIVSLILRIVRVGVTAAVAAGLIGYGLERPRFGPSDESAQSRVEAELRQQVNKSAGTLGTIAARLAADPDTARPAPRDPAALKRLFDRVSAALPDDETGGTGITIYDAIGAPLA